MTTHFDARETRDPGVREAELMARALPRQVAHASAHAPAFADLLRRPIRQR